MDCPRCKGSGRVDVQLAPFPTDLEPRYRSGDCDMPGCHSGAIDEVTCECDKVIAIEDAHVCSVDEELGVRGLCKDCAEVWGLHGSECSVECCHIPGCDRVAAIHCDSCDRPVCSEHSASRRMPDGPDWDGCGLRDDWQKYARAGRYDETTWCRVVEGGE